MRDQRGRGGGNPNLSPAVSSFNSNTNIRDGGKGVEEEEKTIHREECEKAVHSSTISNLPGRQMEISR